MHRLRRRKTRMRTMALIAFASVVLTAVAVLPSAEARTLYCTDLRTASCPGLVCVDADLDNEFSSGECVDVYCGVVGCCGNVCPPPPAVQTLCKTTTVGGTPVAVSVEYGVEPRCLGASYTTCRLSYYPGEPNTPVWVCTTKTII